MVTLTDMKINLDYEYINAVDPSSSENASAGYANGERWLNSTSGQSFVLTEQVAGTWTRTNRVEDNKFSLQSADTFNSTIEYLSNIFPIERFQDYTGDLYAEWTRAQRIFFLKNECVYAQWFFSSTGKTLTVNTDTSSYGFIANFSVGDTVYIDAGRNRGFFTLTAVGADSFTVSEDVQDETVAGFVTLSYLPDAINSIVGRMMHYDIFLRGSSTGLRSERIGTYSYTKESFEVAGRRYPADVAGDLDIYAATPLGGDSIYVE